MGSAEAPFACRFTQGGEKALISWNGRQVVVLSGEAARRLAVRLAGADEEATQLALAKATGNFKRGNERLASTRRSDKGRSGTGGGRS